jgi:large subunit ribosomal protein L21
VAFAVIKTGGKQFRVTEGQVVHVPSLALEVGASVEFEALTFTDGNTVRIGAPLLDQKVSATVLRHDRADKIIVYKFKRTKQYRRKKGHRQNYTAVRIDTLS